MLRRLREVWDPAQRAKSPSGTIESKSHRETLFSVKRATYRPDPRYVCCGWTI
jgi:hypothetical protein